MTSPLVSFCLKSFNQRDFIEEALGGALAQTYRPIEIVICDDCSTDGTWELLQAAVSVVEPVADRTIILHRNEVNLGNTKNWEMCGKISHGELLIKADGDDVSLPDRTAKVVAAWLADGKRAKVITHAVKTMPGGMVISGRGATWPLGAGMAWTRDCFVGWPEIGEDCRRTFDDVIYSLRGLLVGPELRMDEVLVRYRLGSGETSLLDEFRRPARRGVEADMAGSSQKMRDLDYALKAGLVDRPRYDRELRGIENCNRVQRDLLVLLSEHTHMWSKIAAWWRVKEGYNWRGLFVYFLCIFPPWIGNRLIAIAMSIRMQVRRDRTLEQG